MPGSSPFSGAIGTDGDDSSSSQTDGYHFDLLGLPNEAIERVIEATGPQWSCVLAQVNVHLGDVARAVKRRTSEKNKRPKVNLASLCGSLMSFELAVRQGCPLDSRLFTKAAEAGSLEVCKIIRAIGCDWNHASMVKTAARHGHLEVLKWCHAQGCPIDEKVFREAGKGGHLDVLKWLYEEGCSWDAHTFSQAALEGHLGALEWLYLMGCPWGTKACGYAAYSGNLRILQWLRSKGCPWDGKVYKHANSKGHSHVAEWALAHGCPEDTIEDDPVPRRRQYHRGPRRNGDEADGSRRRNQPRRRGRFRWGSSSDEED